MAVGGYGRGELSPHSDIDILVLVPGLRDLQADALRKLLYPFWDAGFHVGHAVRTPKDAVARAAADLHAATALLSARLVAGGESIFEELLDRRARWLRRHAKGVARRILEATAERHRRVQRAGWSLAPDIKEDAGGLRDIHAARWLCALEDGQPDPELLAPGELLLAVRETLHAVTRRKNDRVRIDLQPQVAARLGLYGDDAADALMANVHTAARTIEQAAWNTSEEVAARLLGGPRRSGSVQKVAPGIELADGRLSSLEPQPDLEGAMRLLAARARTGKPLSARAVRGLRDAFTGPVIERWSRDCRVAFLDLLSGAGAPAALELMDGAGAWRVLLPEWSNVRGRAQHDPYHHYTVDGHSFLTVREVGRALAADAVAASAAEELGDLHTLRLAALLHDSGKGSGEDHSVAGERIARSVCARMGMTDVDTDEVAHLVRLHLLLPDTATRRDLDDGAVIEQVAARVGDIRRLRQLYVLAVADGRATGPEAWSDWKTTLVRELYRKTLVALQTGDLPVRSDVAARAREVEAYEPSLAGKAERVLATLPPLYLASTPVPDIADEIRLLLDPPGDGEARHRVDHIAGQPAVVTICVPDRIGTLARSAGVLALNRLSVLHARAYSTTTGQALERFSVEVPDDPAWGSFASDLEAAYSGRLALEARLERKVRDYAGPVRVEVDVRVLQDVSMDSTVVEVRGPDTLGLLYAVAAGISELDLDIQVAKIDTLGERVVDVFYVRTPWGTKLGADQDSELKRAIAYRVRRLFGS